MTGFGGDCTTGQTATGTGCTGGDVAAGTGCAGGEEATSLAGITVTGVTYRVTTIINAPLASTLSSKTV